MELWVCPLFRGWVRVRSSTRKSQDSPVISFPALGWGRAFSDLPLLGLFTPKHRTLLGAECWSSPRGRERTHSMCVPLQHLGCFSVARGDGWARVISQALPPQLPEDGLSVIFSVLK